MGKKKKSWLEIKATKPIEEWRRINRVYGQLFNDYHICIDGEGKIHQMTEQFREQIIDKVGWSGIIKNSELRIKN